MSNLKIVPNGSASVHIEVYEWSNEKQTDILIGNFTLTGRPDGIEIDATKDWRTNHREPIKAYYYRNEPFFHKETFEPLQGVYITMGCVETVKGEK